MNQGQVQEVIILTFYCDEKHQRTLDQGWFSKTLLSVFGQVAYVEFLILIHQLT